MAIWRAYLVKLFLNDVGAYSAEAMHSEKFFMAAAQRILSHFCRE